MTFDVSDKKFWGGLVAAAVAVALLLAFIGTANYFVRLGDRAREHYLIQCVETGTDSIAECRSALGRS